jgi:hypothetical protein
VQELDVQTGVLRLSLWHPAYYQYGNCRLQEAQLPHESIAIRTREHVVGQDDLKSCAGAVSKQLQGSFCTGGGKNRKPCMAQNLSTSRQLCRVIINH